VAAKIEQMLGARHRARGSKKGQHRHPETIDKVGANGVVPRSARRAGSEGPLYVKLVAMKIHPTSRPLCLAAALVFSAASGALAQQRLLSIDEIYDPATRVNFSGNAPSELAWMDATHYLHPRAANGGLTWMVVDAATGADRPLFDAEKMEAAVARLPGVTPSDARRVSRSRSLTFDRSYSSALFTIDADLYSYAFEADRAVRLTAAAGEEELSSYSPNGSLVAFVRDHDLYTIEVSWQRENPERHARLGVRRGNLRKGRPASLLVESRLGADRVSSDRRHASTDLHHGRRDPLRANR
jgi:hypothetical protein